MWRTSSVLRPGMVRVISPVSGSATSRSRARSSRAISPSALARRMSRESLSPSWPRSLARRARACSRSRASAMSRVPVMSAMPSKPTWSRPVSTWRWSWASRRRSSAASGSNRTSAVSTSRSIWAQVHVVGERGELGVDERGGVGGQQAGGVRDPQCFPDRHLSVQDPGPGLGQPECELEDLADVVATRVQRPTQQRGEFHDREVGDQGCAGAGDREPGVQTPLGQRRCIRLIGHDVLGGPFGDRPHVSRSLVRR